MKKIFILSVVVALFFVAEIGFTQGNEAMKIMSPDFTHNGNIPKIFTCQGEDINPELQITNIPEEAKTLALIMDDPDTPIGLWVHWVVYNIPVDTAVIRQNTMPGKEAVNSFRKENYGGPCPPDGEHRYFFKLYAFDTIIEERVMSKEALEKMMEGHIIEQAELIGLYEKY